MDRISVVLVSDHDAGGSGHAELVETLCALAREASDFPAEILLVEHRSLAAELPGAVFGIVPELRVIESDASSSYELKNQGMRAATADIAVILDADCRPEPGWLPRIAEAWRRYPDAVAISGHTRYEGASLRNRVLGLLGRSFLDPGVASETDFISNNNASWNRRRFLETPLPDGLGPFAARLQSESIRRRGGRFYFDPSIRVIHGFEGWAMEQDIRRNAGYGTVIARLHDPAMPHAWVRWGRGTIPAIVLGKTWNSWLDVLRCYRRFELRWWEVPAALLLAPVLIALEVPGMWSAYASTPAWPTAYR